MKNGILIIAICLSACAWTPKDEAWKVSLETDAPEGRDGNCLPVALTLQQKYGGSIAVIAHPDRPKETHAVLYVKRDQVLDNGTLGYETDWDSLLKKGWTFEYWWDN